MLSVKNIVKQFGGVRALAGADLSFSPGQITGIVGPNGSGKTTLMNAITGIFPPTEGFIIVGGRELSHMPITAARGMGITRTFQHSRLFDQMTALDNLIAVMVDPHMIASLFSRDLEDISARAMAVLEQLDIAEKATVKAGTLSYGQRKLLEIARVLVVNPSVVLFDEPFAGLFPEMVKRIAGILSQLRESGVTVILIEHNMELMRKLCDTLYVMDAGSVLAYGTPADVLSRPDVMKAYLGE